MWPVQPSVEQPLKRRKATSAWADAPDYDFETFASVMRAADAGAMLRRQARLERRAAKPVEDASVSEAVMATLEALSKTSRPEGSCPRQHAAWVATIIGPLAEAPPSSVHAERAVSLVNQLRNELGLPKI